jgi:hypothetical protein
MAVVPHDQSMVAALPTAHLSLRDRTRALRFGAILGTAPVMEESSYVHSTSMRRRSGWIRTAPARA